MLQLLLVYIVKRFDFALVNPITNQKRFRCIDPAQLKVQLLKKNSFFYLLCVVMFNCGHGLRYYMHIAHSLESLARGLPRASAEKFSGKENMERPKAKTEK